MLATTGARAVAVDRPQWKEDGRDHLPARDGHPLIPDVSHAGYRLGGPALPVTLYEAQPRHRLRGAR